MFCSVHLREVCDTKMFGASSVIKALRRLFTAALDEQLLRERFPHVHFAEGAIVRGVEKFFPGAGTFIDQRAYLNCAGGKWNGNAGHITLGRNCEIGPYSVLWGAGGITMGDNVHLGAHVSITAHEARHIRANDIDPLKPLEMEFASVVIEDHVLICSGTVIVPGVRIGHHAMIGGGAVVVDDIPPYSLAVGCPARVVRVVDGAPPAKVPA